MECECCPFVSVTSGVERGAGDFVVSGRDEWLRLNNFSEDAIDRGEPTDS